MANSALSSSSEKSVGWKGTALKETDLEFSSHGMRQVTVPTIKDISVLPSWQDPQDVEITREDISLCV